MTPRQVRDYGRPIRVAAWREWYGNVHRSWSPSFIASAAERKVPAGIRPAVHFVGFRADEYMRATMVWGVPDFLHYVWDLRAQRDIAPGDTVVFARHDDTKPPSQYSGPDLFEDLPE